MEVRSYCQRKKRSVVLVRREAKQELQEVYGVRLWSEKERAKLVYDAPKRGKGKAQKS